MKSNLYRTKTLVKIGMSAASLCIISPISIPMMGGVPLTLQTFAVALTGFILGPTAGVSATLVYILCGVIGMPVFSGYRGGFGVLLGPTGGFICGFLPLVSLCGLSSGIARIENGGMVRRFLYCVKPVWQSIVFCALGLFLCHFFGVLQFSFVAEKTLTESAMLVSFPFLIKDGASLALSYFVSVKTKGRLKSAVR